MKRVAKSTKMVLGRSLDKEFGSTCIWGSYFEPHLMLFSSLLVPIGRFGMPFWTQLGAKGLLKSNILVPSRQKMEKNEVQEKVLKTYEKKSWIFDEEM